MSAQAYMMQLTNKRTSKIQASNKLEGTVLEKMGIPAEKKEG